MLGGKAQLAGGVVLRKLLDEGVVGVEHGVVEADAAADEDLLDAGDGTQLSQELDQVLVGDAEVGAGLGRKAAPVGAGAALELLLARGDAEVRRGTREVVYVALEVRVLGHEARLAQDGGVAAALDDAALVEVERAEAALSQAAAVVRDGELDLLDGGDAAGGLVHGVVGPLVRKLVRLVHLLGGERHGRRVLHHVYAVGVFLHQGARAERVQVSALRAKAACVGQLVRLHLLPGGERERAVHVLDASRLVHGAVDPRDLACGQAGVERVCHLDHGQLSHAVYQQVGATVEQDGALERVAPVVVVGKAPERCLDATQYDGHVAVHAPDEVGVHHGRVVRAQAHLAAGGVEVRGAAPLCHGVVVDHGVHVAGGHQKRQARLAQDLHACGVAPVRLADHAHPVAVRLQRARDDGHAKRRVVHVGVAAHVHEVALVPAALGHVLLVDGKKAHASLLLRAGACCCRCVCAGRGGPPCGRPLQTIIRFGAAGPGRRRAVDVCGVCGQGPATFSPVGRYPLGV